ncbi:unnamed protein product [Penicillium salamii]|nr:unnamed protein product [Penicillium salamii]
MSKTFQEWVYLIMKSFMVRGMNSLLQWILDLRTYGMQVSFSTTQPGLVGWIGFDRLLYRQLSFTMGDLRGWIYGLVQTSVEAPSILWSTIADNLSEIAAGWSFLQDSRTIWPVDGFYQRCFRTNAIKRYLTHFARAPEILSVRYRNTANVHRNVFIEDRQVLVLPLVERFDAFTCFVDGQISLAQTTLLWGPDPTSQQPWISQQLREVLQRESRLDLQAGHSFYVAGIVYARQINEASGSLAFRRAMFQNQINHRFDLANCNLDDALQSFLSNPAVRFQGKQVEVLRAIQHGFSLIVAIMLIGGGKSLLFQLPAWISKGLTVVVVSLVALRKELYDRCMNLDISCA